MGVASDHLVCNGIRHVIESEMIFFFGHAGMEDHLQQQVTQFVTKLCHVAMLDRICDFIGFFDSVWCDRLKILFQIPRTTAVGVAKLGHDVDKTISIPGHERLSLLGEVKKPAQPTNLARIMQWSGQGTFLSGEPLEGVLTLTFIVSPSNPYLLPWRAHGRLD